MRILVTGGAGFIGSHIADHALTRGWTVCVIDNLSSGRRENVPDGAEFQELDIRDRQAVLTLVKQFQPDIVSHQAAQASVAVSVREPVLDAEINVIGSLNLLDAAVATGVQRVVFASTGGAIYGEVPDGTRAGLTTTPCPMSPYAASKYAVENYLRCYQAEHGLEFRILRYANVYGPRQDPHGEAGVVAIFMNRLLAGQPIQINARRSQGDDGCVRDYVYIDDVAIANISAADGALADPVTNVCTGLGTSTLDLARSIERHLGVDAEIKFTPHRAGDLERSVLEPPAEASADAASLDIGVKATSEWFKARAAE